MTRQLTKWKMKQLALVVVVSAISLIVGGGIPASADNGPHVLGAGPVADTCAGCHRAHTAKATALLKQAQPGLCFTCHGTTGTGANTDVENGVGYTGSNRSGGPVSGLRGGGFQFALIDSASPTYNASTPARGIGVPVGTGGTAVTSTHSVDSSSQTAWGNGATNATTNYGAAVQLRCGSCHDPHGNGNYRILKTIPSQSGATPGTAMVPDSTTKQYTTTNYWDVKDVDDTTDVWVPSGGSGGATEKTGAFIGNVSAWCSTCHTRYLSTGSAKDSTGDAVYTYRHTSNKISQKTTGTGQRTCIQCHVAHGSNASMSGTNSSGVTAPDGTGAGSSKLLRIDNRGTCQMCHNK